MFHIETEPKFWAKVEVRLPGEPAQQFGARFKVLPVERIQAVKDDDADSTRDLLLEALVEVNDVRDAADKPLTLTPEVAKALIALPHVRGALLRAYLVNIADAIRGN